MTTILIFILVLGALVLVHELGHFIAAKKAGCYVEEFGIGFPPRLFSVQKGETRYAINLLPLGGYVKIKGENGTEPEHPRSFSQRTTLQKVFIVTAGVIMNVVLGYVLISLVLGLGARSAVPQDGEQSRFAIKTDPAVQVVEVVEKSPAAELGIERGDVIREINGIEITTADKLISSVRSADTVEVTYEHNGETLTKETDPVTLEQNDKKGIGIGLMETAVVRYPWYIAPFVGIARVFELLWLIVSSFGSMLFNLVTGQGIEAQVAGPVGIAVLTGEVAREGIVQLLQFTALLSLNLAIINILPIPALDGGRLLFIILERIRGRKIRVGLEHWIHIAGFGALMLLIVLITAKDIATYGGQIWQGIVNLFG